MRGLTAKCAKGYARGAKVFFLAKTQRRKVLFCSTMNCVGKKKIMKIITIKRLRKLSFLGLNEP